MVYCVCIVHPLKLYDFWICDSKNVHFFRESNVEKGDASQNMYERFQFLFPLDTINTCCDSNDISQLSTAYCSWATYLTVRKTVN